MGENPGENYRRCGLGKKSRGWLVEAVIQAEEDKIDRLVEILKKGPPVAHIDGVEIIWIEPKEMLEGFEIKK